jgi:hypothetical protein
MYFKYVCDDDDDNDDDDNFDDDDDVDDNDVDDNVIKKILVLYNRFCLCLMV